MDSLYEMPADVKAELFTVLNTLPHEVDALKVSLIKGTFDGGIYSDGKHACLKGTVCKTNPRKLQNIMDEYGFARVKSPSGSFEVDAAGELENWVLPIDGRPGAEDEGGRDKRALLLATIVEWEVKHKAKAIKKWAAVPTAKRFAVITAGRA
jgi:hypothetical protein